MTAEGSVSAAAGFVRHVSQTDVVSILKILDARISAAGQETPKQELVGLLLNRGFCNLKMQLYRKALKVSGQRLGRACEIGLSDRFRIVLTGLR